MKNTFELIYDVVKQIPYGKVATYGQIAFLAGNPRWSRVVGTRSMLTPIPTIYHAIGLLTVLANRQARLLSAELTGKLNCWKMKELHSLTAELI